MPVLLVDRPVQAEGAHRRLDVRLAHLRVDQHVDGIADHIDAEEDQQRHDEDDQQALQQPADYEDGQVCLLYGKSPPGQNGRAGGEPKLTRPNELL